MEGAVGATSNSSLLGLEYWLQWQVLVCALILILPTTMAIIFLLRNRSTHPLKPADLWATCWTNLHPRFLLFYRAFAFAAMAFLLFQTVSAFGFFVFFFYTQYASLLSTTLLILPTHPVAALWFNTCEIMFRCDFGSESLCIGFIFKHIKGIFSIRYKL